VDLKKRKYKYIGIGFDDSFEAEGSLVRGEDVTCDDSVEPISHGPEDITTHRRVGLPKSHRFWRCFMRQNFEVFLLMTFSIYHIILATSDFKCSLAILIELTIWMDDFEQI